MSRQRPSVSIVINNHNYGAYLGDAIASALAQTYEALEVVVVDDGSTDESRTVLGSCDRSVRVVLQSNVGQAGALNRGVAETAGDLVLFLDSDDLLEPEAAEAMADAWRPGIAKVQARVQLIDAAGRPVGGTLPADPLPEGDVRQLMLRSGGYASTGTTGTAFSREFLDRVLPIPVDTWRRAPDTYLLTLAPFMGEFAAVERVLGRVRIHGGNKWAMRELHPPRLREHLEVDALRDSLLRSRAPALRIAVPRDWLLRSPAHLQSRLASLRIDPVGHPHAGDRSVPLALRGARASLASRGVAARKRALLALWFLAAGTLPPRAAGAVIRTGFLRQHRPSWLQRFIDRGAIRTPRRAA